MRLFLAVLRYEWLLQSRSTRFRFGTLICVAACWAPPLFLALAQKDLEVPSNVEAYLEQGLFWIPFFTLVLAALVAGNTAFVTGEALLLSGCKLGGAGWVLTRLFVQVLLVCAVSWLALLGSLVVATWADAGPVRLVPVLRAWVLYVAPRAVIGTLGWYGLVRVLHSEVAALISSTFGLAALVAVFNEVLGGFGHRLSVEGWTGFGRLVSWYQQLVLVSFDNSGPNFARFGRPTDAPRLEVDLLGNLLPSLAIPAALAMICLGFAVSHLGRCQADQPPISEKHPLRTLLHLFRGLRGRLRADAGLARGDRVIQAMAVTLGLLLLAAVVLRSELWTRNARLRYEVHAGAVAQTMPPTMPETVVPERVQIEGAVARDGDLSVQVEHTLRNAGDAPVSSFTFELNRHLKLEGVQAKGREVSIRREWDRVLLTTEPAVPAGGFLRLAYTVRGRPANDLFSLRRLSDQSFPGQFEAHLDARFTRERSSLAQSRVELRIAASQTTLRAKDVFLEPRWQSWELTPAENGLFGGREIRTEDFLPVFDFEIELKAPKRWVLADSCGGVTSDAPLRVLRNRCRLHAAQFMIAGGRRELVLPPGGSAQLAVLPEHVLGAEDTALALARIVELSDRAWPNLPGLDRVVAVEQPSRTYEPWFRAYRESVAVARTSGQLILVPESALVSTIQLDIAPTVGAILAEGLELGRPVREREHQVVWSMLRTILLQRMGVGGESAWVTVRPFESHRLYTPVLAAHEYDEFVWGLKVPAILVMLEDRVGRDRLLEAVERFIQAEGDEPVGVRDLLGEIEAVSGESLERLYEDHFRESGLPSLTVHRVSVERQGREWRVTGALKNGGRGLANCPLVVRSDVGEVESLVAVESRSEAEFAISVGSRPHTLLLDPAKRCFQRNWKARKTTFSLLGPLQGAAR